MWPALDMSKSAVLLHEELVLATKSLDYERVTKLLNEPACPVNMRLSYLLGLPVECAMLTGDSAMIQLYLECPRIRWTVTDALSARELDEAGIKYDQNWIDSKNKTTTLYEVCEAARRRDLIHAELIREKFFAEAKESFSREELCLLPRHVLYNLEYFEQAVTLCPDINFECAKGLTLLHNVCQLSRQGRFDGERRIKCLLSRPDLDLNCRDAEGKTPLMYAAERFARFEWSPFGMLIENGADLSATDVLGRTAFSFCAEVEHYLKFCEITETDYIAFCKYSRKAENLKLIHEKYPQFAEIAVEPVSIAVKAEPQWPPTPRSTLSSEACQVIAEDCITAFESFLSQQSKSYLADFGSLLLLQSLKQKALTTAHHLLTVKNLSIDLLLQFNEEFFISLDAVEEYEHVALFMLEHGNPLHLRIWYLTFKHNWHRVLDYALERRNDHRAQLFEFSSSYSEDQTEVTWKFLRHDRIRPEIEKNPQWLDLALFSVCTTVEELRYLLDLGVDPRRLVGQSLDYLSGRVEWSREMWQLAFERGLTREDLKNIVHGDHGVYRLFHCIS